MLEQAQGRASKDSEVGVGVILPDAALVLPERHIQLPVQVVFHAPVAADRDGKFSGSQVAAEDVVAYLAGLLGVLEPPEGALRVDVTPPPR